MNDALIGASGFVGSTLLKTARFDSRFRSSDIGSIAGREFDSVVCAGAPAQKWLANRDPQKDSEGIDRLITHLSGIRCKRFVLISTVDVFKNPIGVDEETKIDEDGLTAYGLHRRRLEKFVAERFEDSLIVRLPGLVGPGLRKNVIFDFLNNNQVANIDSRGIFQFYPMVNLSYDVATAQAAGLRLVHLTAEPVSVGEVSRLGFGREFNNAIAPSAARYDMRTRHAEVFGGAGAYQYSARETLQAVRTYAQSEPVSLAAAP